MKITTFLIASVTAALLLAVPAQAAATVLDAFALEPAIAAPMAPADCAASLAVDQAILFVDAIDDCDPIMAELTGLCLAETTEPMPARIAAVFAPNEGISCTSLRPSPPG